MRNQMFNKIDKVFNVEFFFFKCKINRYISFPQSIRVGMSIILANICNIIF
ncbi:hypothetical protein Phpb_04311 [Photorhabdus namnaonensis]|uniref:Uncharacterized protein n=1 Tax=Photorhabdus namnaonensis TaxID=1851568 RepID=A0A1B8YBE7_9GAMM|nr:hypothetical protein Phpb_04311 [Photorhabdus namnaonensis]